MSWYSLSPDVPWLTLILVLPLAGALLVALVPSVARSVIKQLGILSSLFTLALVALVVGGFQLGIGGLHFSSKKAASGSPPSGSPITWGWTGSAFSFSV